MELEQHLPIVNQDIPHNFRVLRTPRDEAGKYDPNGVPVAEDGWNPIGFEEVSTQDATTHERVIVHKDGLVKSISYDALVNLQDSPEQAQEALESLRRYGSGILALATKDENLESLGSKNAKQLLAEYAREKITGADHNVDFIIERLSTSASRALDSVDYDAHNPQDIVDIVTQGSLGGTEITPVYGKYNNYDGIKKRERVLELYGASPETAKAIVENRIAGFHVTNSAALHSILSDKALHPADNLRAAGKLMTGERLYSKPEGQDSISFADYRSPESIRAYTTEDQPFTIDELRSSIFSLAATIEKNKALYKPSNRLIINMEQTLKEEQEKLDFIESNPGNIESQLMLANFPIAFGVNVDDLPSVATLSEYEASKRKGETNEASVVERVSSDIDGEFVVKGGAVSLDKTPVIAVPERYMEYAKELFNYYGVTNITVINIELLK